MNVSSKRLELYTIEGWLNTRGIYDLPVPFIFVVGGRGIGKSFGFLKDAVEKAKDDSKFLLVRRTQTEVDTISRSVLSPFVPIAREIGLYITTASVAKYVTGVYISDTEDGEKRQIGYVCALSTFANVRGVDFEDVTDIYYDEFIPERHKNRIKCEADAFNNMVETVSRNRELMDRPPIKVICMANANNLANPIFIDWELVGKLSKMIKKDQQISVMTNRGIALLSLTHSPISEKKKSTALYKATSAKYSGMALSNLYGEASPYIKPERLDQLIPVVQCHEMCIYKKKSGGYYGSLHRSGSIEKVSQQHFRVVYGFLWAEYAVERFTFETEISEILFKNLFTFYE